MVHFSPRDGEFTVDLECGRTNDEEHGLDSCDGFVEIYKVVMDKKLEGVDDALDIEDKKLVKEQRKKSSNKKAPKPPRPPRGPSLCAYDEKLIKEITEIAMLKRARNERMKALKIMKANNTKVSSSSNGNVLAMAFTVLFFMVILFQGMCSHTSTPASFQGSPESAAVNLISVQYYQNISANENNELDSASPRVIEQVSGSDAENKMGRISS